MGPRIRYLALTVLLIFSMLVVTACGVDTAALAGSATIVNEEEQSAETADKADAAGSDAAKADASQSDGSDLLYDASEFLANVPAWDGQSPYVEINDNKPDFSAEEIWTRTQEKLDELDSLGRCGTANSCIGVDGMPDQPRGNISEVHPTGWHTDKYDFVEGENLYNRCHLIAHKLSGDDAVPRNLITGTSYMNRQGMLPFEDQIEQYVESTRNHVMYRVTPCFVGEELVARGVHMQAISVEDKGEGLSFNVFCYNVEPGIEIDYLTGDNRLANSNQAEKAADQPVSETQDQTSSAVSEETGNTSDGNTITVVLNTNKTRKRIHMADSKRCIESINPENYKEWTGTPEELKEFAEKNGYVPCGTCEPGEQLGIDLPKRK